MGSEDPSWTDDGLLELLNALKHAKKLRNLDLRGNALGMKGGMLLLKTVMANKTLREVCGIPFRALMKNTCKEISCVGKGFRRLELGEAPLFATCLEQCRGLVGADLRDNAFEIEGEELVVEALNSLRRVEPEKCLGLHVDVKPAEPIEWKTWDLPPPKAKVVINENDPRSDMSGRSARFAP